MRKFHLGDVLTITTGSLVSLRGSKGVYDILNYMTGDQLFTHQLPRAAAECRPFLIERFPQLADVDASSVTPENHQAWIDEQIAKYGEEFEIEPIPTAAHEVKDPFEEYIQMKSSS